MWLIFGEGLLFHPTVFPRSTAARIFCLVRRDGFFLEVRRPLDFSFNLFSLSSWVKTTSIIISSLVFRNGCKEAVFVASLFSSLFLCFCPVIKKKSVSSCRRGPHFYGVLPTRTTHEKWWQERRRPGQTMLKILEQALILDLCELALLRKLNTWCPL